MKRQATIWKEAPELALPENPAIVSDCDKAWIAYETVHSDEATFAVVLFSGVIDLHLSPINDEGLGAHPYASLGLRWYTFHELFDTPETKRWSALGGRQFVITFKDVTIDVTAQQASVVATGLHSVDPHAALRIAIESARDTVG